MFLKSGVISPEGILWQTPSQDKDTFLSKGYYPVKMELNVRKQCFVQGAGSV
jgi:hypothetical protein